MAKVKTITAGRDRMVRLQDDRLQSGECPNGCGPLDWVNPYSARCLGCDFTWQPNTVYGGTKVTR